MSNIADLARGRWKSILELLWVDKKYLVDKHGPCPMCGGKDRFRFDDKLNGMWICNQCGSGDGFALLKTLHGWDFTRTCKEIASVMGEYSIEERKGTSQWNDRKREEMKLMFSESVPVSIGDPVHTYLTSRCGDITGKTKNLRYHKELNHTVDGGKHPAMLALMGWDGRKFHGIHRTYLTNDGKKASVDPVRMSYGDLGTVMLGEPGNVLGVSEGIETALCASQLFGIPVWSAICANGMEKFTPPEGVSKVCVFGDNDETFTGQASAYILAKKLSLSGINVEVIIPDKVGQDWADVFSERR